jgi:hypothetical protein
MIQLLSLTRGIDALLFDVHHRRHLPLRHDSTCSAQIVTRSSESSSSLSTIPSQRLPCLIVLQRRHVLVTHNGPIPLLMLQHGVVMAYSTWSTVAQ